MVTPGMIFEYWIAGSSSEPPSAGSRLHTVKPSPPAQDTFIASPRITPVSWHDRSGTAGSGAALTRPVAGRPPLMTVPSVCDTIADGMVMVGSLPPIVVGGPGTLLATITATAPAACALATFWTKLQVPRSTSSTAPAGKPTNGLQPCVGMALPSLTRTTSPGLPASVGSGPNAAPLAR